jgi:hypothetical protein
MPAQERELPTKLHNNTNQKPPSLYTVEEVKYYYVLVFLGMGQDWMSACSETSFCLLEPLSVFLQVGFGYTSDSIAVEKVTAHRFDKILNASQEPVLLILSRQYSDKDSASKATTTATTHT